MAARTSVLVVWLKETMLAPHMPRSTATALTMVLVHSCEEYRGSVLGAPPSL